MLATWRMSEFIPSFDFFLWLAMAQGHGATKIILDTQNPRIHKKRFDLGRANVMERFQSIIEPGPALMGLKSRHGREPGLNPEPWRFYNWVRSGGTFTRLRTVKPAVPCQFTVTIRDNRTGTDASRARDSNREAWERFASEIGATVIDDYALKKIHLHDRMALYAGARMNFGVSNGPMFLITMSNYPAVMWANNETSMNLWNKFGIQRGEKSPNMLDNHHLVWAEDTLDNLRRHFDELKL